MNRYASRKFLVTLLALLLGTWMRFRGVLSDESTLSLLVASVLGYQGGNVAARMAEKPADKPAAREPAA